MNRHPEFSYVTFSRQILIHLLSENYGIQPASIIFLKRGFNDTYRVQAEKEIYILRVYRGGRRSIEDIRAEVKLLLFLHKNKIPVSVPVAGKEDTFVTSFSSSAGKHHAVLFSFVEGKNIRKTDLKQSYLVGESLGKMHASLKTFGPVPLHLNYNPTAIFDYVKKSLLRTHHNFPSDLDWLNRFEISVEQRLKGIILHQGICHGDIQTENYYFQNDGSLSFIDFDFSGTGPLLYDLGAYTWYDHKAKSRPVLVAFLEGYVNHIKLGKEEIALIPLFGALRGLFLMGMWNDFMDGESNPVWMPEQVSDFILKLKKWLKEECEMEV